MIGVYRHTACIYPATVILPQQIPTLTPEKLGERLPDEVDADEEHEEKEDEDGTLMVLHDTQHRIHPQVRYEGYPQNPAHMEVNLYVYWCFVPSRPVSLYQGEPAHMSVNLYVYIGVLCPVAQCRYIRANLHTCK